MVQRAARAGMFLMAGHRRGAVVENHHDVAGRRRIVNHLRQPGHAAVNERAVADHAHHALRLAGGNTWRSPRPMPMLEPMHTQQSIAEYGGNTPSA